MIHVTLLLFASLRERAKTSRLERDFADGITVREIWNDLVTEFPALNGQADALGFAVNHEYVDGDFRPKDNDEIGFIPPVSGGADPVVSVEIGKARIDVAQLENLVAGADSGAVVTFVGTVRNENVGRRVLRLEYEAYEPMALKEMRTLAYEAASKFRVARVAISHRVGILEIGEASVAIAVSAAHRAEAFDACEFLIDRIKEIVPIWKKEHFEGGEIWVGCQTSHPPHPQ